MCSLSMVIKSTIAMFALAGAAHGLAIPTANPGHGAHELYPGRDGKLLSGPHVSTTAPIPTSSQIQNGNADFHPGKPMKVIVVEATQNATSHHDTTIPASTTTTITNPSKRSAIYDILPMMKQEQEEEAEYAAYRYSRPTLTPLHAPNTSNHNLQAREEDGGDKDGTNWCAYRRTDSGFRRIWELVAPRVPNDQIPSICGGLWDNLKRFGTCLAVTMPYCGPQRYEHEGEAGLEWVFKIDSLCDSGMLSSTWWEATGHEEEWFGNMWCDQVPWGPRYWQDGVNEVIKFLGNSEEEKAEAQSELVEGVPGVKDLNE